MTRIFALAALLPLAACGPTETAVTAAAGGASEAQQAKEAPKLEQQVKDKVEQAQQLGMDNLKAQDKAAEGQ
jgi:hypothetical protein